MTQRTNYYLSKPLKFGLYHQFDRYITYVCLSLSISIKILQRKIFRIIEFWQQTYIWSLDVTLWANHWVKFLYLTTFDMYTYTQASKFFILGFQCSVSITLLKVLLNTYIASYILTKKVLVTFETFSHKNYCLALFWF